MRILIVGSSLRESSIGGGEQFIVGLVNALANLGEHDIVLAVGRSLLPRMRDLVHHSVEILSVCDLDGIPKVIRDMFRVHRWAKAAEADVTVFPHEWKPLFLPNAVLVLQNIIYVHPVSTGLFPVSGRIMRTLARLTMRRATTVVAVSTIARQRWSQHLGRRADHCVLLPEGVTVTSPSAPEHRARHVGLIATRQGHKNLGLGLAGIEEARGTHPDITVEVLGCNGPETDTTTFRGFVEHRALLDAMSAAEIVVFPSAVESFGLPAFEALALGTKCIVLHDSAMHEWLGSDVTTFDGSPDGLGAAIVDLLGEGTNQPASERFAWSTIALDWQRVIEQSATT